MFWLILGSLVILYCILVRVRLGRVRFSIVPLVGGMGMLLLGVLIQMFPGLLAVWILQLAAVTVLAVLCGTELLVYTGSLSGRARSRQKQPVQCTIVLGSGLKKGNQLTSTLIERLTLAEKLYQGETVILSGGQTAHETAAEADVMKEWLLQNGVIPAEKVLLETESVNTRQNLRNTRHLYPDDLNPTQKVRIVTSDFHCWRVARLAAEFGLSGASVCGSRTMALIAPMYHLREVLAIIYGAVRQGGKGEKNDAEK